MPWFENKAAYVALPRSTTRRCPSSPHRSSPAQQCTSYAGVFTCRSLLLPQHLAKQNIILAAGLL